MPCSWCALICAVGGYVGVFVGVTRVLMSVHGCVMCGCVMGCGILHPRCSSCLIELGQSDYTNSYVDLMDIKQ